MTPSEIIDEMNSLLRDQQEIDCTVIDCVVDARADEGLPPFTPEELAAAEAECDRNGQLVDAINDKISALQDEYRCQTGEWPIYVDGIMPTFREPFRWERRENRG